MSKPRALTEDEVRAAFLAQVRVMINYWRTEGRSDKLEGLAHSIMAILDGKSSLPLFKVIVSPHPDDKEYHREQEENWYPEEGCDISGALAYELFNPK